MTFKKEIKEYVGSIPDLVRNGTSLLEETEEGIADLAAGWVGKLPSLNGDDSEEAQKRVEAALEEIEKQIAQVLVGDLVKRYKIK